MDMIDTPSPHVHCWENGPLMSDGCPTSCMLPDEHLGDHEWTRDDQITITFAPLAKT